MYPVQLPCAFFYIFHPIPLQQCQFLVFGCFIYGIPDHFTTRQHIFYEQLLIKTLTIYRGPGTTCLHLGPLDAHHVSIFDSLHISLSVKFYNYGHLCSKYITTIIRVSTIQISVFIIQRISPKNKILPVHRRPFTPRWLRVVKSSSYPTCFPL